MAQFSLLLAEAECGWGKTLWRLRHDCAGGELERIQPQLSRSPDHLSRASVAYSDEMKRIALFLFFLSFTALTNTLAQKAPPAGSISAAKILEGHFASIGGLSALKEVTTLRASGNFGLSLTHPLGGYTFLYKAPNKDVLEVQLISHGMSWTGRREEGEIRRATVH